LFNPRIGVIALANPAKGLWKCALTAAWAGGKTGSVSVFPISDFRPLYYDPQSAMSCDVADGTLPAVPAGSHFLEWLENLDLLVCIEQLLPEAFRRAIAFGVSVAFVPNLDWATLYGEDDTSRWLAALRDIPVRVWARTPMIGRTLRVHGVDAVHMPWSIADPVCEPRDIGSARHFVCNGGLGGWRNRRGLDTLLASFPMVRRAVPDAMLVVKTIQPLEVDLDGVSVSSGWWTPEDIDRLYSSADAVLHPSRWEGFGLPQMESLHAGVPVLATNGWPMSELMDDLGGLPIPCSRAGNVRLAAHWECDPQDLAAAMIRFCTHPETRRAARPVYERIVARQQEFLSAFRREAIHLLTSHVRKT
jgi:glycosyltransferase involved in cell wall biosynthesis